MHAYLRKEKGLQPLALRRDAEVGEPVGLDVVALWLVEPLCIDALPMCVRARVSVFVRAPWRLRCSCVCERERVCVCVCVNERKRGPRRLRSS